MGFFKNWSRWPIRRSIFSGNDINGLLGKIAAKIDDLSDRGRIIPAGMRTEARMERVGKTDYVINVG
jgi:hypothetical protein